MQSNSDSNYHEFRLFKPNTCWRMQYEFMHFMNISNRVFPRMDIYLYYYITLSGVTLYNTICVYILLEHRSHVMLTIPFYFRKIRV